MQINKYNNKTFKEKKAIKYKYWCFISVMEILLSFFNIKI